MSDNDAEKIKGTAQKIGGNIKEGVGNLVNDPELANKGRAEQVVGEGRVEGAKTAEQVKGVGEQIKGAVKGAVGAVTGDDKLRAEGELDDAKGKLRQKTNE